MQIVTQVGDLRKALSLVSTCASKKNTLPILSHVLITATDHITLTCSNLDEHITLSIPGGVPEQGVISVEIKDLKKVLVGATGEVSITGLFGASVHIHRGNILAAIKGTNGDEFPPAMSWKIMQGEDKAVSPFVAQTIPASALYKVLSQTIFTASTDQARPVLCGVKLDFQDHQITATSTNGFAGAIHTETVTAELTPATGIWPGEVIEHLLRFLSTIKTEEVILETATNPKNMVARIASPHGRFVYSFNLINGQFPDLEVICKPHQNEFSLLIPFDSMQEYLGLSFNPVHREGRKSRNAYLPINLLVMHHSETQTEDLLGLQFTDEDNATTILSCVPFEGPEAPDGFTANYGPELLYEGIQHAKKVQQDKSFRMVIHKGNTPARIYSGDSDAYMYVIMPMHMETGLNRATFKNLLDLTQKEITQ